MGITSWIDELESGDIVKRTEAGLFGTELRIIDVGSHFVTFEAPGHKYQPSFKARWAKNNFISLFIGCFDGIEKSYKPLDEELLWE